MPEYYLCLKIDTADRECSSNACVLQDDALQQIQLLVPRIDWNIALKVWSMFSDFPHVVAVPNPVVTTTSEEHVGAEFAEKLQSASEQLNVVHTAPKSENLDGERFTEQFVDDASEGTHIEKSMHVGEAMNCSENCMDVKVDTEKCTDNSGRNISVGHSSESEVSNNEAKETASLPSFRATCHRTGTNHCFQSPDAAAHFGGAVQDYFGWKVDLSNYDIEVVLCIEDRDVRVGISLTQHSLHRRHITHFGSTTLRPTVAHGMLR